MHDWLKSYANVKKWIANVFILPSVGVSTVRVCYQYEATPSSLPREVAKSTLVTLGFEVIN